MTRTANRAVVLFAHGARDPQWAEPFHRIRQQVMVLSGPDLRVELAFLELMEPSLEDCVRSLWHQGVGILTLVPLFMAQGGHLKKDLPRLVEALQEECRGLHVRITPALGESSELILAMADWVVRQDAVTAED